MLSRSLAVLGLGVVLGAAGCAQEGSGAGSTCDTSGRCDTPQQQLAKQSLQLLGANVDGAQQRCHECHSLTRSNLREWLDLTQTAKSTCLSPTMAPLDAVNCLRADPTKPDSQFVPSKLGIYAAAAHLDDLQTLFKNAYPAGQNGNTSTTWLRNYTKFKQTVSMPRGSYPKLTKDEFATIANWFAQGLPALEDVLPEQQPPATCVENYAPELAEHLNRMKNEGWSAVNRDRGLSMLGCNGATDPSGCLGSYPLATDKDFGQGWAQDGGTLRLLRSLSFTTTFWSRSSPDGRFFAAGGVKIVDLQNNVEIPVDASYDPGFFPDNSGFVEQGTPVGAGFCNMSLLTSDPMSIHFNEPQCIGAEIGLYQYLGASLGGGDYFVVSSEFDSDNGGHSPTLQDPTATFGDDASITLTPMVFDGTKYAVGQQVKVSTQFEGDTALSPSTLLVAGRLAGPNAQQLGYVIRKVNATKDAAGYTVEAPEVARICVRGGKANFSLDERFLVTHHYVEKGDWQQLGYASADAPEFKAYLDKGASNIVVVDLATHQTRIVTRMNAGQYALYPHFRSDGWLYFLVRDTNTGVEHVVASDAALRIQAQQ
jgi:hypothetical protein